jgi:phospholipase C
MAPKGPKAPIHPAWQELALQMQQRTATRRKFISGAGAGVGGLALWSLLPPGSEGFFATAAAAGSPDLANWPSNNPIKHVVILCQENRSFDHYFGAFASTLGTGADTALGFEPSQLTYYDSSGTGYQPYHLTHFCDEDPDHSWEGSHTKWNSGAMDGWVTDENGQTIAIGYFEPADHIYHVQLAHAFTIADHYFCSQIGPTLPNRLYLWSGTSGWHFLSPTATSDSLPYNNPDITALPPVLSWQTMPDVLEAASLPWKCYSVADGSVPSTIGAFNPLIFFSQFQDNPERLARATADFSEFIADLAAGTLPAVSWIVTEAVVSEHPPAPPDMGQLFVARVVQELMASSAWSSTALFVAYDEGGGFFEHVAPDILENVPATLPDAGVAVGPAFRVPLFVVSPYAPVNKVFKEAMDHTSILQFIERTFSTKRNPITLSTIAPARRDLADLTKAFDFKQAPSSPTLPTPAQLFPYAKQEILTLNLTRTLADCSINAPSWLASLLGV